MTNFSALAQEAFSSKDFPPLPEVDNERRDPNFEWPPEDPSIFANLEPRELRLSGHNMSGMHIYWVIAPRIHLARDALDHALALSSKDGLSTDFITGRVTTPAVLDLVDGTFGSKSWRTYVELGGQALNLGCIVDSPQSEGLHDELARHIDTGSPFIAFSPDLA